MNISKYIFSVAPMVDVTNRHFRYLGRLLSSGTRFYSEMIVAEAIGRGKKLHLLDRGFAGKGEALQLAGTDLPSYLCAATHAVNLGYDEVNINVGCPSSKAQSGGFGVVMMRHPEKVALFVGSLVKELDVPVTIKCRVGIKGTDKSLFRDLIDQTVDAGASAIIVHARMALLSRKRTQDSHNIPSLEYEKVYRLKQELGNRVRIVLNGGIKNLEDIRSHLCHVDGVMLGRAAAYSPQFLAEVDKVVFGINKDVNMVDIINRYATYCYEQWLTKKSKMRGLLVPLHGFFKGSKGVSNWRKELIAIAEKYDLHASLNRENYVSKDKEFSGSSYWEKSYFIDRILSNLP